MTIQKFLKICHMSEADLARFLKKELEAKGRSVYTAKGYRDNLPGFIYSPGTYPVMLIAHMDTVFLVPPDEFLFTHVDDDIIISSPQGIGGDDRCGITMILDLIEEYDCSVLFVNDEEVGGIGAEEFLESLFKKEFPYPSNINYMLEIDRKGCNEAVFYYCENKEFQKFITKEFFVLDKGTFTDISILAPILNIAAVNVSAGYYDEHSKKETVHYNEMLTLVEEIKKLLERSKDSKFKYEEKPW